MQNNALIFMTAGSDNVALCKRWDGCLERLDLAHGLKNVTVVNARLKAELCKTFPRFPVFGQFQFKPVSFCKVPSKGRGASLTGSSGETTFCLGVSCCDGSSPDQSITTNFDRNVFSHTTRWKIIDYLSCHTSVPPGG